MTEVTLSPEPFDKMSVKEVVLRGVKKILTEATSIKFLLLAFVCIGAWQGFIEDTLAMASALALVGLREVPIGDILGAIFKK